MIRVVPQGDTMMLRAIFPDLPDAILEHAHEIIRVTAPVLVPDEGIDEDSVESVYTRWATDRERGLVYYKRVA